MLKAAKPSPATLGLSLLAGILVTLNQLTFDFGPPWKQVITFGILALSSLSISPLLGPAFHNSLHLSHRVTSLITTGVLVLGAAIQTFHWSTDAKGIVLGVLALLAGLGFGSAGAITAGVKARSAPPVA